MFKALKTAVAAGLLMATSAAMGQVAVDKKIPDYKAVAGISGNVKSVGSDSLNNLMTLWAEDFKKVYPNISIEIEGKGSATAPPALIEGTAQLGPMSRSMKEEEVDNFKKKFGFAPTPVRVAVDALAVFVNKDNPIRELSFDQLRSIYSVEGKNGVTWGEMGVVGELANKPISLYGRNSASGTYGYFKEHALSKKDFKATVKEQPGSSAVVQGVAADKTGIGYSGVGYVTADVKAIPVKLKAADKAYEPTATNAYSGDYPLSRFLYIYVNAKPGVGPSPIVGEFIKYVLSQQGQQIVVKDGYFPLLKNVIDEDIKGAGIK